MNGTVERRPAILMRVVSIGILLLVAWFIVGKIAPFFVSPVGKNASVLLTVRESSSVQFSLQGQDWQTAVTNVKLYPGDKVMTKVGGDATLTFFDGTRIRLDEATEISVEDSDHMTGGTSTEHLILTKGRIWVATPDPSAFTGSITRTITTNSLELTIPFTAQALVTPSSLTVLRSSGIGIRVTLNESKKQTIFVGEGQMFSLPADATKALENGKDPYDYRDPLTTQAVRDTFIISSIAPVNQETTVVASSANAGEASGARSAGKGRIENDPVAGLGRSEDGLRAHRKGHELNGMLSRRLHQATPVCLN